MKKGFGRYICLIFAAAFIFSLSACGSNTEKSGKHAWIDTNIIENQYAAGEMRLQDDFAAAANAEWLSEQVYDPVYKNSTFRSADLIVNQNKRAILDDESLDSKNLKLVRIYDSLFSDRDHRKELGTEPLKKYMAYIDDIGSISDVSSYITDNSKNPFAFMLLSLDTELIDGHKEYYTLRALQPEYSLGDALYYSSMNNKGIQKLEEVEKKAYHILGKAGMSEKEIEKLLSDCFKFESELVSLDPEFAMNVDEPVILGADEFFAYSGAFPLKAIFDHYGLSDLPQYYGDYKYISGLSGIYDDAHVEGIKAYFKVNLALASYAFLDWETFDYCTEAEADRSNPFYETSVTYPDRYLFIFLQRSFLNGAMDQAYLDAYYDEDTANDLRDICGMLVDAYKEIIDEKDWLSAENKQSIKDKLDNIEFFIMKPSNTADYSDMELVPKEEGGTLLDAYAVINEAKIRYYKEEACRKYSREFWDIYDNSLSTTQTNAFYDKWNNSVVIQAGIVCGDFYGSDMEFEQKLGAIGSVLGHEISHGFDSHGVYFDLNGDRNYLINGDDMGVFSSKAGKVRAYFVGIKPFEGADTYAVDNDLSAEAIADMGGVKSAMVVASGMPDFDYDLYFRSFAAVWRKLQPKGFEIDSMREGGHPLSYLRINVTLQQFDEFYSTYNVTEGDDMYLAPDKRIAIW